MSGVSFIQKIYKRESVRGFRDKRFVELEGKKVTAVVCFDVLVGDSVDSMCADTGTVQRSLSLLLLFFVLLLLFLLFSLFRGGLCVCMYAHMYVCTQE